MQLMTFLTEYIKHPQKTGALAPSSKSLAKKMVDVINFEEASYVMELGPGTGAFTKEIIKRKKPGTIFILIEINKAFYKRLEQQYKDDPSIVVIHGSAENIKKYIHDMQIDKVDYVVSGLPFASLPTNVSTCILDSVGEVLKQEGSFITFQYSLFRKTFIQSFFPMITKKKVWFNFPPAYVFNCKKRHID
jgi:phosphatidylethanolamine/phosphatidyl-N-methylethanolamine N-methyltransferase